MNDMNIKNANSTKESTPFHIYKSDLVDALISVNNYDVDVFNTLSERVSMMWANGEPLWMAYSELRLRMIKLISDKGQREVYPSPMSLAKRVVYMD
jgi:hypothetical protein